MITAQGAWIDVPQKNTYAGPDLFKSVFDKQSGLARACTADGAAVWIDSLCNGSMRRFAKSVNVAMDVILMSKLFSIKYQISAS